MRQRTLKNCIHAEGVGVHSGKNIRMCLKPAPEDTGIVFRRTDLTPNVDIPAISGNVSDTMLCTNLNLRNVRVGTIEHLMSALAGLGVDNAIIELSGAEVPIMDGSSAPFVFLIQSAGLQAQAKFKQFVRIKEEICIEDNQRFAKLSPYEGFSVSYNIEYAHPTIRKSAQSTSLNFSTSTYIKEISRARTFGFLSDYEWIKSHNLGLGASLENAVVLDDDGVMNKSGLRHKDEFIRHKLLDAIGDLYLLGKPLIGAFHGSKSGHYLNNLLIRKLLDTPSAYEIVTISSEHTLPIMYTHPALKVFRAAS